MSQIHSPTIEDSDDEDTHPQNNTPPRNPHHVLERSDDENNSSAKISRKFKRQTRPCTTDKVNNLENQPHNLQQRNPKRLLEQSDGEGDSDREPKPSGCQQTSVHKSKKRVHMHDHSPDNLDLEQPNEDA